MDVTDKDLQELKNALLGVDYGKIEIQIHAGSIASIAVTKITKQTLTKKTKRDIDGDCRVSKDTARHASDTPAISG